MAKFLTERAFLSSFFKFDEAQSQQNGAIEALVSVKYIEKPGVENRDAREIDQSDGSIAFEELVAV